MDDATLMKLLEMLNNKLESVIESQAKMDVNMQNMTSEVSQLRSDMEPLKAGIAEMEPLKQSVLKIQITQENITNRDIKLLLEDQKGTQEKFAQLDRMEKTLEDVKTDSEAIKFAVQKHSSEITDIQGELKIVK